MLFYNAPTCPNVYIDVSQTTIKQHPYRVNPVKRQHFYQEMQYMMEHGSWTILWCMEFPMFTSWEAWWVCLFLYNFLQGEYCH